ncbi:hypothetical protein CK510_28120, partial [Brunnivagina elsteri CCALA 953]
KIFFLIYLPTLSREGWGDPTPTIVEKIKYPNYIIINRIIRRGWVSPPLIYRDNLFLGVPLFAENIR